MGAPPELFSTFGSDEGLEAVLDRLFAGESYRFEFGGRRGVRDWFTLPPAGSSVLPARRVIHAAHPDRTLLAPPAGVPLLRAFAALIPGLLPGLPAPPAELTGPSLAAALSERWPHDYLLLSTAVAGQPRLVAGAVCFPSSWDPAEKLGRLIDEIHEPVPGLNEELAVKIRTFISRLPPGITFERENWGLAATPEPNLHPARGLSGLPPDATEARVWLRVEHQAFRALPEAQGVVFVIALTVLPLGRCLDRPERRAGFLRILRSLSPAMAAYKGLARGLPSLLASVEAGPSPAEDRL